MKVPDGALGDMVAMEFSCIDTFYQVMEAQSPHIYWHCSSHHAGVGPSWASHRRPRNQLEHFPFPSHAINTLCQSIGGCS